ncbi:MAG: PfkB family carbohydrate kinase, partial [Candidatus Kariarchaeaceae archaeon]
IPVLEAFGYEVEVITSFNREDFNFKKIFPNVKFHIIDSDYSTTFKFMKSDDNEHLEDDRLLILKHKAENLTNIHIQLLKKQYDIVIISPIANELEKKVILQLSKMAKHSFIDVQGLTRRFSKAGSVIHNLSKGDLDWMLANINIIKASKSELTNISNVKNPNQSMLLVTDGGKDLHIFQDNKKFNFKMEIITNIVDPTGSGDIFLASFAAIYSHKNLDDVVLISHLIARHNLKVQGIPKVETIKKLIVNNGWQI